MRPGKIQRGTNRDDLRRIDIVVGHIVVPLDVI